MLQNGGRDTSTNTLTVNGKNDASIAGNNTNAVEKEVTLTASGNVITDDNGLNNRPDTNAASNPATSADSDVGKATVGLRVIPVGGRVGVPMAGTYGSLVMREDGSYIYTLSNKALVMQSLAQGEAVFDSFDYLLLDEQGGSDTATLTIKIAGENTDTDTVFDGNQGESETTAGNTHANGSEIDQNGTASDDVLSVLNVMFDGTPFDGSSNAGGAVTPSGTLVDGLYGTLSIDSNGEFIYTVDGDLPTTRSLALDDVGVETFVYRVSDGKGGFVEEQIVVRVVGAEGGKIGDFVGVGESGILEGFRFAEPGRLRSDDQGAGGTPLLFLRPTYSGTAEPGSVINLTVMGTDGIALRGGNMTVVADPGGAWIAKFGELELGNFCYCVQVEARPPVWNARLPGKFSKFFAPVIKSTFSESEILSIDSVFGRRLSSEALHQMINTNRHPRGTNRDWRTEIGD